MKRFVLSMIAAGMLANIGSVAALAQNSDKIQDRRIRQQQRIGQGVENGTLSPKETANLEHKESKLNKEIRTDRKLNGGNLTNNEKAQINNQQNRLSRQIYNKKHDGPGQ